MIKKFDVITKLYEEATQEVTESPEKWLAFLQSASKNYRLPFDEQLLIHMQRPEATAVLPMGKWNEKFGRWVKRDSKGIAVFDKSSDRLKLKYYFDVSDTREGKYKRLVRPVSLWSVSEEQQKSVKEALVNTFGVTDGDRKEFAMVILEASLNIAEDNIGDYLPDILLATKDSPLEEIDEFNIRLKMKQLLANSISYMLFLRCGIEPDIYLETRDFQNIRDFHTKELVNLFGVAASDMSEMALGEVADTIRKLKIQERKQRTFVEQKTTDYNVGNKQEIATERGQDNGSNHIQQTGRLSPAESYNSRGRGSSPWEVRISPKTISDEESVRNVSESSDSRNIEPTSDSDGGRSTEQNGDTYSADGRERGSDRRTESQRSDGVDRENEQYPAESAGNREERNPGELKWHDRSSEEYEIAFLSNDEIIKSLLLFAPHLKATNAEIRDFYESHEERKDQMEYVKSLFPTGVTEYTLENGDTVGFDKYENVLHIWRGTYENRIEQGYYDWYVIAGYYDGMRVLGELKDSREALLSVDGQLQLIDDRAAEGVSAFSFTQGIIDRALQSGSSFSEGKYRIYCYFKQGHSMEDTVKFLKNEYGVGGRSSILTGTGIGEDHDGKGLKLHRGYGENSPKILLKWSAVAKRIGELIDVGRYLSKRELEGIPDYERRVLAGEIYHFYYNRPENVMRPYLAGTDYYDAIKLLLPQLKEPERVTELVSQMSEVLEDTADFDTRYDLMQKAYQDVSDYQQGRYSLTAPITDENTIGTESRPVVAQVEPEAEQHMSSNEAVTESENESADYDVSEDTVVTIGMKDYEVEFLSAERVVLRDQQYPIFSEELSREEFDRKIRENPANDHLKIKRPLPELPAEEEKEAQPTDVPSEETETELSIPEQNYQFVMKMAGEVLRGEVDSKTYEAGSGFMPLTIEQIGDNFIAISHYYEQNGDAMADPDMEFAYDNDRKTLQARTYQQDALQRYDEVYGNDGYNEELEEELNLFAYQWFQSIEKQGYVPVQEAAELEAGELPAEEENTLELAPSWEQGEPAKKAQSYNLYPEVSGQNRHQYQITEEAPEYGSAKEKFRANIAAIQLLKKCENEHRYVTPEEQEILAKYVGWGGLSDAFDPKKSAWTVEYLELQTVLSKEEYESARESTLTAFYTPPIVIKSMYQALENMGLKSGNILEPSCGVGNFIGMKPEALSDCKMYGVELDSVSGRIAAQLYQKSKIAVEGYEKINLPDSFFDVAIGNVPFGEFKVFDSRYDRYNFFVHDYFFAKTLDKVRPGGVIAFITSSGTMDKKNPYVRRYLAQRADLIGAIRLPNDTFTKNAGTKVTSDILFLQKRDHMTLEEPDWVYLDYDANGIEQNRYYVQHPEMILGEMIMESGPYGMRSTCRPYEGRELSELLSGAVEALKGTIEEVEMEELVEEEDLTIPADPSVSNYSYTLVDGKIYYRENSRMKPVTLPVTGINRVKGMIAIRDCARELIRYQTEGYSDEVIEGQQKELNHLYDLFRSKYGLLNDRANMRVFADDNSYPLLSSLEILAEDGTLERKADMFSKRTIKAHEVVNSVDTASEALSISLAEKAKVDMSFMAELTGKTEEELEQELSGVVFRLPDSDTENPKYVSEDEYLSGNVRKKLKVAELAAQADVRYQVNVTALQKVQPKDLSASEINIRLGTTWLPESDVEDFMFQLLNTPNYMQWRIKVHFSKYTGEWQVEGRSQDKGNVKANNTYGTTRASAYRIIEDTLNLRDVRIYDYVEDEDGKKKAVLNKKETAIAQGKQDLIKQAFQDWIWKDPERRQRLTDYYNENFNAIRPREYDGSHLHFYGMNPEIRLREHQKNGVARILYGGNTLLAYVVGAGKTYTMVAAAMESKRLGLCHKSMVVVPNHIIEQFAAEWLQLYPAANLLVATKKDFETKNRKWFCARIATSDVDAVIIGHSQFEKIPLSIERQQKTIRSQIEELVQGITEEKARNGNKFTIKQLEKTKKSLLVRLEKLNDQSKKDQVINFEELGIDRLFVDEADGYKNLYLYTKMRNVAGIAQTEALKSSDMFMKCQYLDELTGGKGVVFATGTPVSNSMVELYTMQRYLQHHTLVEHNLQHFDAWASTFGETVTAIELAPEGTGYRLKTRFAKFYNLPELMQMFREVADIQTADMLNLPVPEAEYRVVSVKPSEMQRDMVAELGERAERVREGMVNATEDNMLLITNDGRKLALDQRMMNELLPDYPESKVNACVEEVYNFWEQGQEKRLTQLVFCDLSTPKTDGSFSVYNDVRDKLIAKGVPPEEIAFIHDANTEVRKKELFSKVRRGAVRILMGSTFKMGAGTNVQDLIIASHDLDCPWRPRDLEQRAGRTVRQGNKNPKVDIVRYVTEGTFDAYLYQIIENKQKFISQIMTSKSPARSVEDIDEVALSYAEIKALAVGNPYIKEKMDLDIQVSKLQLLKQSFLSQKYEMEDKAVRYFPNEIKQCEQRIEDYESDIALAKANTPSDREAFPEMQIHDVVYTEKKEAGQAIIEACKTMRSAEAVLLGRYRGFALKLSYDTFQKMFVISMYGKQVYHVPLGSDIHGNITRLDNKINEIPDKKLRCQDKLENLKVQLENAKEEAKKAFPQEAELAEKVARLGELNVLLDMDKKDQVLLDDGEGVEIEPEQNKKERER